MVTLDPSLNPWERQPGETEASWRGFQRFLQTPPPRSLASMQGIQRLVVVKEWRDRYAWDRRADAFDKKADADLLVSRRRDVVKMVDRHGNIAAAGLNAAARVFAEINARMRDGRLNLATMGESQLREWGKLLFPMAPHLVEMERLARGVPGKVDALALVVADQNKADPSTSAPTTLAESIRKLEAAFESRNLQAGTAPSVFNDEDEDDVVEGVVVAIDRKGA